MSLEIIFVLSQTTVIVLFICILFYRGSTNRKLRYSLFLYKLQGCLVQSNLATLHNPGYFFSNKQEVVALIKHIFNQNRSIKRKLYLLRLRFDLESDQRIRISFTPIIPIVRSDYLCIDISEIGMHYQSEGIKIWKTPQ